MKKHLNNFLDKAEGLPKNTSNNNIKKEIELRKNRNFLLTSYNEQKELENELNN